MVLESLSEPGSRTPKTGCCTKALTTTAGTYSAATLVKPQWPPPNSPGHCFPGTPRVGSLTSCLHGLTRRPEPLPLCTLMPIGGGGWSERECGLPAVHLSVVMATRAPSAPVTHEDWSSWGGGGVFRCLIRPGEAETPGLAPSSLPLCPQDSHGLFPPHPLPGPHALP